MRDDPGHDPAAIVTCLDRNYGLRVASIAFLPLGYDPNAWAYAVAAGDGTTWFLKIRRGEPSEPALEVPRALIDAAVPNILAPVRTRSGELWGSLDGHDGHTVTLFPFVRGESAMATGMSDDQWRTFGAALRAVHDSGLHHRFRDRLPVEDFGLAPAEPVRRVLALVETRTFEGPAAARFQAFWRAESGRIRALLARAEALGRSLRGRSFETVLCHTDIHADNILVGEDGRIWLVDWDEPKIAPRERDLLFVVGSRIAREVTPREEALCFAGYGPAEIAPDVLVYYRHERVLEDLWSFGESVFLDEAISEASREDQAALAMALFAPGGDVDSIEHVPRRRWP